ncbi:MAG: ABC transporter permease [Sphingobacteriales bacterium]|nr:ABC transporter permease [Sphingobacteriales bacterium]MBI3718165.1 ABC transporter permease [Sphingobacteriales bacterium]
MSNQSYSFAQAAFKRLKKNKAAVAGLIIILAAVLLAALCYLIAPDSTPNADRQIVEIQSKKPGFSIQFLKLPKENYIENTSFFERIITGKKDAYIYLPINSYKINGDKVSVQKFIDDGVEEKQEYSVDALTKNTSLSVNDLVIKKTFWLGTDKFGRDILSRMLIGIRVSLSVGLIAVLISLTIGILLGSLAGYFRGRVDEVIMWFINVIWSIPTLLLVFAITLALGKGFWQVFIAVGLTMWVSVARLIRGQVLSLRELEYIEAAKALGYSNARIIFRHILPNVMGPVIVIAASNFATAIVIEAGLSFLGVGVQAPQPSWGLMIKENYNFIITHNPFLAIAPGIAIMILVLAFNLLGNGLRDALDVKGKL